MRAIGHLLSRRLAFAGLSGMTRYTRKL